METKEVKKTKLQIATEKQDKMEQDAAKPKVKEFQEMETRAAYVLIREMRTKAAKLQVRAEHYDKRLKKETLSYNDEIFQMSWWMECTILRNAVEQLEKAIENQDFSDVY